MTDSGLARRIRLGEDSTLELKQVFLSGPRVIGPARRDFAAELAAFANGRGGTLILGVDDKTRDVIGIPLERLDTVQTWVREICTDSIDPPLDAEIRKIELPDAHGSLVAVIRVDVERSLYVHMSPGGVFRRLGDAKRKLSAEGIARLVQQRTQTRLIRFDESIVPRTSVADLEGPLVSRFLREDTDPTEDNARKLGVVADDEEGAARLTVAGALLCARLPRRWLPHAEIQAVCYAGERHDVNYQRDARDLSGPLDAQVREALHFVRRNMRVEATKSTARMERPQFSERALFEALVNAVAHRDYSMAGARIRLHLFGDRIELYVPGGIANTLTPDNLHLRQYSRNELIVSLLARCPAPAGIGRSYMMDRRGDGVPIIREETRKLSGYLPEYRLIDDSELRLTLTAAGAIPRPSAGRGPV